MEEWGDDGVVGGGAAARAAPKGNGRFLPKVRKLRDLLIVAVRVRGVGCEISMSMCHGKGAGVGKFGRFFSMQHGFRNFRINNLLFFISFLVFGFFIGEPEIDAALRTTFSG